MTRTRIIFLLALSVLLLAIFWWLVRSGGEEAKTRASLKAVPVYIANLSVPMSLAWDARFELPGSNAELERFGTPVGALGQQADGTSLTVTRDGIVEVLISGRGSDQGPGRLSFLPNIDIAATPPSPRVHTWRCLSDNLPSIAQILPGCAHVLPDERVLIISQHQAQLASAATALRPPEPPPQAEAAPEPGPPVADAPAEAAAPAEPASASESRPEPLPTGPSVSLTPEEVDRALKGGQSLEQALADKRRLTAP